MAEQLEAGDHFLQGVGLEINQTCNLYCEHCFSRGGENAFHMETETVKRVLREIREELKPFEVDLAGGEPTLHPDFEEIIAYASEELGLAVTVSTNGTRYSDDLVSLFDAHGVSLGVSLSSADPASHDAFRGMDGAFAETVEGIERFVENDIRVSVRTTVTQNNVDGLEEIAELAADLGASETYFLRFVPTGRGGDAVDELALTQEQMVDVHGRIIEMKSDPDRYGGVMLGENFPNPSDVGKSKRGFGVRLSGPMAGVTCINVTSRGEVNPDHSLRTVVAGNVHERSIGDIWEDSEAFEYLRNVEIDECTDCEYFGRTCVGGSRKWSLLEYGRADRKDPKCWHEP